MDFKQLISARYSCRAFSSEAVSREQLAYVLEAGRLAPTAKNLQEHHIYVVESAEGLAAIDSVTRYRYNAQTCLVVAFDKGNVYTCPGGRYDSGREDVAIVATHMMLAAKSIGLDTCWLNAFDPDVLHERLALPEHEEIVMILDIGHPAPTAAPGPQHTLRKPLEETVTFM